MTQNSADFHLPDEILAVIPTDPYDQLDLARKITSMAIASRVSRLDGENDRLRQVNAEKDRVIAELQERLEECDRILQESDARLKTSLQENIKLSKERDSLMLTTKKLSRELSKLEAFKRNLMQSLSADDSSQHSETVDIGTCDQFVPKNSNWKDGGSTASHNASSYAIASTDVENLFRDGTRNVGQKLAVTSYVSPKFTPSATPKITSTTGSPRRYSAAGSPKLLSGTTSPTKPRVEGHALLSPWYPSSQRSSAANSPPRGHSLPGRTPRIDGKEFFRQARSRLSYEQFGEFLANIKELNAHRQSREETLKKAEEIFGTDNKDLYLSFQGLLNRNIS